MSRKGLIGNGSPKGICLISTGVIRVFKTLGQAQEEAEKLNKEMTRFSCPRPFGSALLFGEEENMLRYSDLNDEDKKLFRELVIEIVKKSDISWIEAIELLEEYWGYWLFISERGTHCEGDIPRLYEKCC